MLASNHSDCRNVLVKNTGTLLPIIILHSDRIALECACALSLQTEKLCHLAGLNAHPGGRPALHACRGARSF